MYAVNSGDAKTENVNLLRLSCPLKMFFVKANVVLQLS